MASFGAQLGSILGTVIDKSVRSVTERALTRIRVRTPVGDTGNARRGWESTVTGEGKDTKAFITNGIEYIEFLEEGSSQQAPHGMVAVTLSELSGK